MPRAAHHVPAPHAHTALLWVILLLNLTFSALRRTPLISPPEPLTAAVYLTLITAAVATATHMLIRASGDHPPMKTPDKKSTTP